MAHPPRREEPLRCSSLHSDCAHDQPRQPPGATILCSSTSHIMAHPPRRGAPLRCFHYTLTACTIGPGNPGRYRSLQQHIASHGSPARTCKTAAVFSLHSDCVHDRSRQPRALPFAAAAHRKSWPTRHDVEHRCGVFHYTLTAGTIGPGNLRIHCTLTGCTTGSGQRPLLHTLTECTTSRSHPD
eukprot:SAG31_NODE_15956_length_728_cov_21.474603_1_plen_183_part_01